MEKATCEFNKSLNSSVDLNNDVDDDDNVGNTDLFIYFFKRKNVQI